MFTMSQQILFSPSCPCQRQRDHRHPHPRYPRTHSSRPISPPTETEPKLLTTLFLAEWKLFWLGILKARK